MRVICTSYWPNRHLIFGPADYGHLFRIFLATRKKATRTPEFRLHSGDCWKTMPRSLLAKLRSRCRKGMFSWLASDQKNVWELNFVGYFFILAKTVFHTQNEIKLKGGEHESCPKFIGYSVALFQRWETFSTIEHNEVTAGKVCDMWYTY